MSRAEKIILIEISIKEVDLSRLKCGENYQNVLFLSDGPPELEDLRGIVSDLSPEIIKKANKGGRKPKRVFIRKKIN